MTARPDLTADTWPIAVCMHGFAPVGRDGIALHDAPAERWDALFAEVAALGFTELELADSHIRPADLEPLRSA